jgi:hypothetical protein
MSVTKFCVKKRYRKEEEEEEEEKKKKKKKRRRRRWRRRKRGERGRGGVQIAQYPCMNVTHKSRLPSARSIISSAEKYTRKCFNF